MPKRVQLPATVRPRQWTKIVVALIIAILFAGRSADAKAPPCPCPPAATVPPVWTGSAGFGLSLNRGNTDTTNVNLSFEATRDPKQKDIWRLRALYMRGDTNGEASADRFFAQARYERNLSTRL